MSPVRADLLSLDGNGDYVTFPATGIPSGSASFTIEAWINPISIPTGGQDGGQMTFWGNESGNQANGFRLRGASGLRHFFWANDHDENLTMDILPNTTGPNADGWHHFALTWNGTQTRWYWNGVAIGSPRTAAGVNVQSVNHRIGARFGGGAGLEFFHGSMDEVRVWNVARSTAEIAGNFQQELNGDEAGLVAYWNFEGNLTDRAGANNNGTAVGNAVTAAGNAPVLPVGPRIYSFAASTNQIFLAQSVTLSWAVSNATSVAIDQGIGPVTPSNSLVVAPSATTTYTLTATNANSARTAMVTVMVDPGVPLAFGFSTNTPLNTPVAITLRGSDPQGSNLTYAIVSPAAHGNVNGTPPNVTYTPTNNHAGLDNFTFKVNDGAFDSAPATVSIYAVPPPTPPHGIVLSTTNIPAGAGPGAFLAALRALDVNESDTHTFALVPGFGDNTKFAIAGNALNAGPSFAGGPDATFSIRVRATDNGSLNYEQNFTLGVVVTTAGVVINEIHFNSPQNTIREEFIELHNPTAAPVDLSNWRLRGGIDYFFPLNTTIPAGGFLVVAEDPITLANRYGVTALGPWTGGINNSGEEITLRDTLDDAVDRVDFQVEFPWPIAADGDGASMQLVNPSLDNDLGSSWRPGTPPTPGATNNAYATNAAPNIRQVNHSPKTPASTNAILITAKVTDPEGVASVTLRYQLVAPGSYISATVPLTTAQLNNYNAAPLTNALNGAFEAASNWVSVAMNDSGLNGDAVAGDGLYSAAVPQQANRTLVRYRITCTDTLGASRRAPFEDDPSLNFAYYVYDGVPAYLTNSGAALQTLPVFTLITRDADLTHCTAWFNGGDQLPQTIGAFRNEGRLYFNWEGAMVHDGEVYDHIRYRLRGANGRYHSGKRSFRFRFNDGRHLDAKDQTGERFPRKWRELTTGKGQSNRGGEQYALNEVVNMFLWNKVGVPAPRTFHFHFRVVRGASEAGANQYSGDFWGLNWGQEKYDVNFLEAHGLPKGNLYKLFDNPPGPHIDEQRYQGPFAVTNGADLFSIENNLTGFQNADWLNAHANYTNWYRYFTVAEAIRHYDTWPSANKNGAYYFEPLYGASNSFLGRMIQLPYDSTDTWGPTWNNGEDILFNGIFASTAQGGDAGQNPAMQLEYRNVVRELRELLFQPDQIISIIDAHAVPLLPVAAADHARWLSAPAPASYSSLGIPSSPGVTGGLPAYQQDMKNFMFNGGNNAWWIDRTSIGAGGWITRLDTVAADVAVPNRPTITFVGTNGYPVDGLVFQSSAFSDPQGAGTFRAMQWRVAEVLLTNTVVTNLAQLRLEYDATWTSAELPAFDAFTAIPAGLLEPERLYRARVRHKDNTGRWSRWSAPIEFRPRAADIFGALRRDLVFNELNYNPPPDGATDGDDFEFIELKNKGTNTLELTGLSFSDGVEFSFTNGTRLAPGALFLLAPNPAVLATRYPGVVVHGIYAGKLNNDGERVAIAHSVGGVIVELEYSDRAPWPVAADGFGFSLAYEAVTGTYRAGGATGGSPGSDAAVSGIGGVVVNEVLSSSTLPLRDSIELVNDTGTNISIGGWYLSDDPQSPFKYRIPDGTTIVSGDELVFDESQFNPTPGFGVSFSLSSFGDDVYLFSSASPGTLSGYSHGFEFGGAQDGVSFGRYVNSVGDEHFPLQLSRTPDTENAGPRVGPVVISEIHYHPRAAADEFIELRNIAATNVPLYDPAAATNTWRLSGLGFDFPMGVVLPPGGFAMLVNGEPAAFRARWSVPPAVPVFQYTGADLQDSGEQLELRAPDLPTTNGTPYYAVDAVRYNDRAPWPLAADGAGASLQRLFTATYGNDPSNWYAAAPTPGAGAAGGIAPTITSQPSPSARTNAVGGTATFTASASGSALLNYQWRFDGDIIEGATNATLLLNNLQLEGAGAYSLVVFNGAGSAESSNATLVVRVGATVTSHPTNVAIVVPPDANASPTNRATFSVGAVTFNPPLRYQWQFNGAPIAGATNATHTFTNVQFADGGSYRCAVADEVGETLSAAATLTPIIRPRVIGGPFGQHTNVVGRPVTIGVMITGHPPPFVYKWMSNSLVVASNFSFAATDFHVFNGPASVPAGLHRFRVEVTNFFGTLVVDGVNRIYFTNNFLADANLNGLPDTYETNYGMAGVLHPLDDADNDGLNNLAEYLAGTDPTNAASYLRVEIVSAGGGATLQFGAVANRSYTIQRAPVVGGPWTKVADFIPLSSDQVETIFDPDWTTNRFYRAVTPRQP